MNTDVPDQALLSAEHRVLEIQTKLHRWATDDAHRRFDDLFNLVADPGFLLVAWDRVRGNRGARTAGVDGQSVYYVEANVGVEVFYVNALLLERAKWSDTDNLRNIPVPIRLDRSDVLAVSAKEGSDRLR